MSIVAPVASTGVALPVLVGLAEGERPSTLQVVGVLCALGGVVLASRAPADPDHPARVNARAALVLAMVAAVGIGMTFVGLDRATETAGVAWSLLVSRGLQATLLTIIALAMRPALPTGAAAWAPLMALGLLDVSANALFAIALGTGLLSIVSVLSSLYPAVTVLLARTLLHERVSRGQEAGVLAILAGVVAISAG
jgi:drug/metabolite transporter (DMT)-like permease